MKINGKGKVIALDHEEHYHSLTKDNIKFHGLNEFVEVIHAPLKKYMINEQEYLWYDLKRDYFKKPIDLIIVDGPPGVIQKGSRYPAIPILFEYMNDGCIVLVDDYLREDEKEMVVKWISEFGLEIVSLEKAEKGQCVLRYKRP
jgi:predicted O-methyltransferase YrrM